MAHHRFFQIWNGALRWMWQRQDHHAQSFAKPYKPFANPQTDGRPRKFLWCACYGLTIVDALQIAQLCKTNHTKYIELVQDDMLAIDDLGTEPVEVMDYGNIITPVIDLLTKRYEAQLFTNVTTNLDPKDIRKRYGDRIADRLNEMMAKIVYRNPTYRMDETQTDGMS